MAIIKGLKIVLAKPKRKRNYNGPKRMSNKLFEAIIVKEKDDYFAKVTQKNDFVKIGTKLTLTEDSFILKGCKNIFSREKGEHGYNRIIRSKEKANIEPGIAEMYVPFAPNWIIKGYIINNQGSILFDFKRLVGIADYRIDEPLFTDD